MNNTPYSRYLDHNDTAIQRFLKIDSFDALYAFLLQYGEQLKVSNDQ
jgi:hypothetical protein